MWGWLSSVVSGLETIWQSIVSLPVSIVEGIGEFFGTLWDWLKDIWDAITSIPDLILEGLKEIFIPDTEELDATFNSLLSDIKVKLGVGDFSDFTNLFDNERPVDDIKGDYTIPGVGTFNITFLDTTFLKEGVAYFRPFIRGFLVLLMLLFHVKQLIGFFGYDAGVVAGRSDAINESRKEQRGG